MKILITGGSGYIGSYLCKYFSKENEVYSADIIEPADLKNHKFVEMDITNKEQVSEVINNVKPITIIHCAASKDVRFCENNPKQAKALNVDGTKNVAEACRDIGCKMIYLSTDYVFDGIKGMYKEDETPNPNVEYSKTKYEGEIIVKETVENYVICRSGAVYGKDDKGISFVSFLINNLKEGNELEVFDDLYQSPTYIGNLAEMMQIIIKKDLKGIFHTVGSERISRYELSKKVARIFGFDENFIKQAKSQNLFSKRGKDVSLDTEKSQKDLDINFMDVKEGLAKMKEESEISKE